MITPDMIEARQLADRKQRAAVVAAQVAGLLARMTGKLNVLAPLLDELFEYTADHGSQDLAPELMMAAQFAHHLADERLKDIVGDVAARLPSGHNV